MQGDGLAEDGAIGVETPLPEAVTQHGWDGARDVLAIVRGERPAVESGDSKHLEKLRCGQVHADLLGRQGLIHCYKHLVFAENARQSGGMFGERTIDRKSTRLNSSHLVISYAVFCLKKKKK